MNNNLVTKLLQYANSGDSDQAASDAMRKAALKIEYLEELVKAVNYDTQTWDIECRYVRGEDWRVARKRALASGNE